MAWDSDGRCMAISGTGLVFWDGTEWKNLGMPVGKPPNALRFIHRSATNRWLVGCADAGLIEMSADEMIEYVELSSRLQSIGIRRNHRRFRGHCGPRRQRDDSTSRCDWETMDQTDGRQGHGTRCSAGASGRRAVACGAERIALDEGL